MRALIVPLLLVAPLAAAQPPLPEPLPPPAMEDPGVEPAAPLPRNVEIPGESVAEEVDEAVSDEDRARDRLTGGPVRNRPDDASAPTVAIRTLDNGDVVEEYRVGGQITMLKVTPVNGVPYTLVDSNGDGSLDQADGAAPVSPVLYELYSWD
ncbi:DUF2782 domain-containing protein [Coralloluteibacterium stylophorae]|nr:DUF2782 domain-containing protein [Coralloluteibacterium stylophorae]